MRDNKYGYKVCYKKKGKRKIKTYLVTNTYNSAVDSVRWYENSPPKDRQTQELVINVVWIILPIKNFIEYKWRWKGCPF